MRTTIDIDDPILREVKKLQKKQGKSLGRIVSDLLARALHDTKEAKEPPKPFHWITKRMDPLVDIEDKEALYEIIEGAEARRRHQP